MAYLYFAKVGKHTACEMGKSKAAILQQSGGQYRRKRKEDKLACSGDHREYTQHEKEGSNNNEKPYLVRHPQRVIFFSSSRGVD